MKDLGVRVLMLLLSISGAVANVAFAAGYPERPITLIVGFPAGTASDVAARVVAQSMATHLRTAIVVENKPGVSGSLAMSQFLKAKPDGYSIILSASAPVAINPHLYKSLGYTSPDSFVHVGQCAWVPLVLLSGQKRDLRSVQDFVRTVKSEPGTLMYASSGSGTLSHLLMMLLAHRIGATTLEHIPYSGNHKGLIDLMAGNVDVMFETLSAARPHIESGKLRALGVSAPERVSFAPSIPTIEEQGIPNLRQGAWLGISAPKGTPRPSLRNCTWH